MIKNLLKIQKILTFKEKRDLFLTAFLKFLLAIVEMVAILSFIPFLSLIANKENTLQNKYLVYVADTFSFNEKQLYIFLIVVPLILILSLNILRPLVVWHSSKTTNNIWFSMHSDLFNYYLNKKYLFHTENSSNILLERIMQRTNSAIAGVVFPTYEIIGNIFSSFFIIIIPIIYNPYIAISSLVLVGLFYFTLYRFFRKKISEYGNYSPEFARLTYKLVEESLRSIKDIKIRNNQLFFLKQFQINTKKYADNAVYFDFYSSTPRSVTEIFAFSFTLITTLILLIYSDYRFNETIIILGVYLLAIQRLVPIIQNFFHQFSALKFYRATFDSIYDDLRNSFLYKNKFSKKEKNELVKFNKSIELKNIKFSYPGNEKFELYVENLKIKKGSIIGISGKSGVGKSTFLNILSGLIEPNNGEIFVDDIKINHNNLSSFQKKINYVPQNIFVLNDTIRKNIAFGVENESIDNSKIINSAKLAGISNFIENDLENGYDTLVGENAIKLSGGQRQRIGLARAFYEDKDLLILDEATNSLDKEKEVEILENLKSSTGKTIIFVTHNTFLLSKLDKVIYFEDGILKEKD